MGCSSRILAHGFHLRPCDQHLRLLKQAKNRGRQTLAPCSGFSHFVWRQAIRRCTCFCRLPGSLWRTSSRRRGPAWRRLGPKCQVALTQTSLIYFLSPPAPLLAPGFRQGPRLWRRLPDFPITKAVSATVFEAKSKAFQTQQCYMSRLMDIMTPEANVDLLFFPLDALFFHLLCSES